MSLYRKLKQVVFWFFVTNILKIKIFFLIWFLSLFGKDLVTNELI